MPLTPLPAADLELTLPLSNSKGAIGSNAKRRWSTAWGLSVSSRPCENAQPIPIHRETRGGPDTPVLTTIADAGRPAA